MKLIKHSVFVFFIITLCLMILPQITIAAPSSINVLNLEYKKGDVNVIEKFSTIGYYPDRKIQPENGYFLEILGENNSILYSFRFSPPEMEYLDGFDGTFNLGGKSMSDFFNFSLIVPSYYNEKEVRITNDKTQTSTFFTLKEEKLDLRFLSWLLLLVATGIILVIIYGTKRDKKEKNE